MIAPMNRGLKQGLGLVAEERPEVRMIAPMNRGLKQRDLNPRERNVLQGPDDCPDE